MIAKSQVQDSIMGTFFFFFKLQTYLSVYFFLKRQKLELVKIDSIVFALVDQFSLALPSKQYDRASGLLCNKCANELGKHFTQEHQDLGSSDIIEATNISAKRMSQYRSNQIMMLSQDLVISAKIYVTVEPRGVPVLASLPEE